MAYIDLADVRDVGITEEMVADEAVETAIALWQALIERACRQWFEPREMTLKFDGNDSALLPVGVPIISIEYLKLNNDPVALDATHYRVYKSRSYPDDRRNPRIMLNALCDDADIYTAPIVNGLLKFRKGRQNQEIKGTFGFVEEDDSTPLLIKRALLKLVVEKLATPVFTAPGTEAPLPPPPPVLAGIIQEERTDGHALIYANRFTVNSRRPNSMMSFTSDPEIIEIIKMYRAPIGICTPAHPSHTSF
jgi:hypothetical protein